MNARKDERFEANTVWRPNGGPGRDRVAFQIDCREARARSEDVKVS
jgi:hypothetical protein